MERNYLVLVKFVRGGDSHSPVPDAISITDWQNPLYL